MFESGGNSAASGAGETEVSALHRRLPGSGTAVKGQPCNLVAGNDYPIPAVSRDHPISHRLLSLTGARSKYVEQTIISQFALRVDTSATLSVGSRRQQTACAQSQRHHVTLR